MKVLVTGGGGQLGHDLVGVCLEAGDDVVAPGRGQLDVGDRDAVLCAVLTVSPDVIVHAAGWTAVDACESDPASAFRVNALACRHVAEGARLAGAHLVSISTDYVFDGEQDEPYVEWDRPNPLSVYGRSKLGGEAEVLHGCPSAAVVRTSWLCGSHGANVVKTVLKLATRDDRPFSFVDDQRGCPTFTADLAPLVRRLAVARLPGLFHVTNDGPTTWYRFACAVMAAAGHDPARVRPVATDDLDPPRPAPRPRNSVLDNAALRALGIARLPHWQEPLERLVKEL